MTENTTRRARRDGNEQPTIPASGTNVASRSPDAGVDMRDRRRATAIANHPNGMTRAGAAATRLAAMSEHAPLSPGSRRGEIGTGTLVLWVVLLNVAFWPRLWILAFWLFSDRIGAAFSSWVIPAVGFVFLPWTTLLYAWMWAIGSTAVTGWEWIIVAIGLFSDLFFWVAGRASLR